MTSPFHSIHPEANLSLTTDSVLSVSQTASTSSVHAGHSYQTAPVDGPLPPSPSCGVEMAHDSLPSAMPLSGEILETVTTASSSILIANSDQVTEDPKRLLSLLPSLCKSGNAARVKKIVDRIGENITDDDGNNALHLLFLHGSSEMVQLALNGLKESIGSWSTDLPPDDAKAAIRNILNGPPSVGDDEERNDLLHFLTFAGPVLDRIRRLIDHFKPFSVALQSSPLAVQNKRGQYPLQLGHKNPQIQDFYSVLAAAGVIPSVAALNQSINHLFSSGQLPRANEIASLLMCGLDIETTDSKGQTLLARAVTVGNFILVKKLVEAGACVNVRDHEGNTPLMSAFAHYEHMGTVDRRYVNIVDTLLAAGADTSGAEIDQPLTYTGITHLIWACSEGNVPLVNRLLDAGANTSIVDREGTTAYLCALERPAFDGTGIRERLLQLDNGTSKELLMSRELVGRFSLSSVKTALKNTFTLPNGQVLVGTQRIRLSGGWNHEAARTTLAAHLRRFYANLTPCVEENETWSELMNSLSEPTRALIQGVSSDEMTKILSHMVEAVEQSTCSVESAQARLRAGKPVALFVYLYGERHVEHTVTMVYKPLEDGTWEVALINKDPADGGYNDKPGIRIYKTSQFPLAALSDFYPNSTYDFFNKEIINKLSLTDEVHIPLMEQRENNCVIVSSNAMPTAIIYMGMKTLLGGNHEAAIEFSKALKKASSGDARLATLTTYLDYHEQPGVSTPTARVAPTNEGMLKKVLERVCKKPRPTKKDLEVIQLLTRRLPGNSPVSSSSNTRVAED